MLDVVRVVTDELYDIGIKLLSFIRLSLAESVRSFKLVSNFVVEVNFFSEFGQIFSFHSVINFVNDIFF